MITAARSAVYNVFFFGMTTVLALIGNVVLWLCPRRVAALGRLWARLGLWGARWICGMRLAVTGREHIPTSGAALIACQHQSAFDTMVWLTLVPQCSYVLKIELTRIPVFGRLLRPIGMIAIDREGGGAALRLLLREGRRAQAEGRQVIIFPEGTRAAPGTYPPLQPGIAALASVTGLPVIAAATNSGLCWGRRTFRKRAGTVHLKVFPPLPASLERAELMRRLESAFRTPMADGPVDKSVGTPSRPLPDDPKTA